jgi:hypothetical protein
LKKTAQPHQNDPRKPIYLVWCAIVQTDRILYYLRAVCTSKKRAEMYQKTVEYENKMKGELRRSVVIEHSLSNHLYAERDMGVAGYGPRGNMP